MIKYHVIDNEFNRENNPCIIGDTLDYPLEGVDVLSFVSLNA